MLQRSPRKGVPATRAATIERAAIDSGQRRLSFVASDETVDRYGDIIRASGWKLENFRRNPILLFGHDSDELPIGRVPNVYVDGTRLIADVEFMPEGMNDFADDVWKALDGGFLQAVSVGFMPLDDPGALLDGEGRWTGFEFTSQELLELSVVPVPANPGALALARALAISERSQRLLFVDDGRAAARVAASKRRTSLTLARLKPGFFNRGKQ